MEEPLPSLPKKRTWHIYLIVAICLLALFLSLPSLLSSFGKSAIEKILSKKLDGKVEMEKIQLSWFQTQKIENFDFESNDLVTSLSVETLSYSGSLFDLLLKNTKNAKTHIKSLVLKTESLAQSKKKSSSSLGVLLTNMQLEDGFISITSSKKELLVLSNLEVKTTPQIDGPFTFAAQGKTSLNDTIGAFSFKGSLDTKNKDVLKSGCNLDLSAKNFPTLLLDTLSANGEDFFNELFGSLLNLETKIALSKNQCNLNLALQSENFNGSLETKDSKTAAFLSKPSTVSFTVTPKLFSTFKKKIKELRFFNLLKPGGVQLVFDSFKIPLSEGGFSYKEIAYQGRLLLSSLNFTTEKLQNPFAITSLKLAGSSDNFSQQSLFKLQSSLSYFGKNPSSCNGGFTLNSPFQEKGKGSLVQDIEIDAQKFPTQVVDTLYALDGTLEEVIGESFSIKSTANTLVDKVEYIISFSSPRLQVPNLSTSLGESIYLEKPSDFTYIPSLEYLNKSLGSSLQLEEISPLKGKIESFGLSLANLYAKNYKQIVLHGNINADKVKITSPSQKDSFVFEKTVLKLSANNITQIDLNLFTTLDLVVPANQQLVWGKSFTANVDAAINLTDLKNIKIPTLSGRAGSDRTKIIFEGSLDDSLNKLVFTKPVQIEILPSPELLNVVLNKPSDSVTYVPFVPVIGTIHIEPIYLNKPLMQNLAFTADLKLERFDIVNKTWFKEFSIINTKARIEASGKTARFSSHLTTSATFKDAPAGAFSAKLTSSHFSSFDFLDKELKLELKMEDFSTHFMDTILGFNNKLGDILGHTFDLHLDIFGKDKIYNVSKEFNSAYLYILGDFLLAPNFIEVTNKDFKIDFLFTKEGYAALEALFGKVPKKGSGFDVSYATLLHTKLHDFYLPLPLKTPAANDPLFFQKLVKEINRNLSLSKLSLESKIDNAVLYSHVDEKTTSLENLTITLSKKETSSPFVFSLLSEVKEKQKELPVTKGSLAATGSLQSVKEKDDTSTLHTKVDAKMQNFPSLLIDTIAAFTTNTAMAPSILIGDTVNASLQVALENLSGTVDFTLDSKDAKANFNSFLNDGIIKLSKPISASFTITKKLADHFLQNMNITLQEAKNPLSIFVSEKGFFLPLNPFDMSRMQIRFASVNLGQILCANTGSPEDIGGFFKLAMSKNTPINLWFAPMDFSIANGYMNIDRTEVLYNKAYQVAIWGKINLMKKYVDMNLGLTEQALRKALGIQGLPRSFVLQIPMQGPVGNVRINKEVATTRIAFLLAKASGITKQGGIWGGLANMLGDMANDQSSIPPPKPPFPWETALNDFEEEYKKETTIQIIR